MCKGYDVRDAANAINVMEIDLEALKFAQIDVLTYRSPDLPYLNIGLKGPPEIKDLRVTLNQMLNKVEAATKSVKVPIVFNGGSEESSEYDGSNRELEKAATTAVGDELGSSDSNSEETSRMDLEEAVIFADEDEEGSSDFD
ncbi:MAG: hypothetical protein Q9175_006348 [Cornicularia normoerica]